jgi:hypothetical protein
MEQLALELGDVWTDELVRCACSGRIRVCDVRRGPLVVRTTTCVSCGAQGVVELRPPETPEERTERIKAEVWR